jgi:beta-glucosidase
VLLKNDGALPLAPGKKIAIASSNVPYADMTADNAYLASVGLAAGMGVDGAAMCVDDLVIDGGGSAQVTWSRDYAATLRQGLENAGFIAANETRDVNVTTASAAADAAAADAGIFVLSRTSSEGADNGAASFNMGEAELKAFNAYKDAFTAAGKPLIVLINAGASVRTQEFTDGANAILDVFLPGTEGAYAIGDALSGKINPSGKLTSSFPLEYNDSSSVAAELVKSGHEGKTWAAEEGNPATGYPVYFDEGVYVGYRCYTTFDAESRISYPFGHGLSYTSFKFSDLKFDKYLFPETPDSETLTVSVKVTNTGTIAGKQVVELYLGADSYKEERRPIRELKAFGKTRLLQPGESEVVELTIDKRDLQYFDDGNPDNNLDSPIVYSKNQAERWTVEPGTIFTATISDSSAASALEANGVSEAFAYGGSAVKTTGPLKTGGAGMYD